MGNLFEKNIDPRCIYCRYGRPNVTGEFVLCPKMGVREAESNCNKFEYNPLKRPVRRTPKLDTSNFKPEDFLL